MAKDMDWKQPYEQSMALCRYIGRGSCKPSKVEEYWHRAFCCIAKYLGFNGSARKILWEDLVQGNWEHLHEMKNEEGFTSEEWLEKLREDCFYCSDRWSLDRLTRCHLVWRQYVWAVRRDNAS